MKFNPYIFIIYGIIIVFSGLAFLAIFISRAGKIFSFLDKHKKKYIKNKKEIPLPGSILGRTKNLFLISNEKEKSFYLPDLIDIALKTGIENPWEVIDLLIRQKVITADGEGMFLWNEYSFYYRKIFNTKMNK